MKLESLKNINHALFISHLEKTKLHNLKVHKNPVAKFLNRNRQWLVTYTSCGFQVSVTVEGGSLVKNATNLYVATYKLNRLLGFNYIPPTVIKEVSLDRKRIQSVVSYLLPKSKPYFATLQRPKKGPKNTAKQLSLEEAIALEKDKTFKLKLSDLHLIDYLAKSFGQQVSNVRILRDRSIFTYSSPIETVHPPHAYELDLESLSLNRKKEWVRGLTRLKRNAKTTLGNYLNKAQLFKLLNSTQALLNRINEIDT